MSDTVLVTGGTGFVAGHVVAQLLDRGDHVRATVRDLRRTDKVAALQALAQGRPGTLELVAADLLTPGAFDDAAQGVRYVFHVASPFLMPEQIRDGQRDVVEPALAGTRHVLDAIEKAPSVERLVLTSTVGAIFGDYVDVVAMRDQTLREEYVNTTSTVANNPYHFAKTRAEQLAWDAAKAQDRWSMVTINPGLVLGPSYAAASDSGSLLLMGELMSGKFFYGAPNFAFTFVDVREVATAHLRAAERPGAHGRYILARPEMVDFHEMAQVIRARHPRRIVVPRHRLPDAAVRVLGPRFGLSQDYIRKHLGIRFAVDNGRSVNELGIDYRPVAETIIDHYDSWRCRRRAAA